MEDSPETYNQIASAATTPTWGQIIHLRPSLGRQVFALTPAWAAIAGALAGSNAWDAAGLLRLLTVILLVELVHAAFFGPAEDAAGVTHDRIAWLPYSQPDSPSGRLARWWGQTAAGRVGGCLTAVILAGVLALWVGLPAIWALLALLALGGLRLCLGRLWAGLGRWIGAVAGVLIPWLLAGALFGGLSAGSLLCALLYTAARGALIDRGRLTRAPWALILAGLCQLAALILLIALKRPLAAALLAIGLAAQVFIQALGRRETDETGPARLQLLLVAGMLLAAATLGQ